MPPLLYGSVSSDIFLSMTAWRFAAVRLWGVGCGAVTESIIHGSRGTLRHSTAPVKGV